jgi:hypothetical protein
LRDGLQKTKANAKLTFVDGWLVRLLFGPRVKKETAAPVGGRRRRFSAAAAEQSPMGLEVLSLFEQKKKYRLFVFQA